MDNSHHLLAELNEAQREAVALPAMHALVLAGAGSGKTRVLVHRIAWLLEQEHCSPFSLLAVTFTNKAAAEMRGRIQQLMGMSVHGMWVGTFHHIAHRLLRTHWEAAKLLENFQIIDSDDQLRLIKRILKARDIDEKRWPPRQVQGYINGKKDEGLRPESIGPEYDHHKEVMRSVYRDYQEACERAGLLDFAELLLRAHELLLNNPEILAHYQQRFKHVLVDEFQDTNKLQYAWLRLLVGKNNHIMIVGDDDQSIYGWRGAQMDNIHRFQTDFKGAKMVRLEQNYRSTETILQAANALIENNGDRLGKSLWTEDKAGEPITLYSAYSDMDETSYVVSQIQARAAEGTPYEHMALLYRSNAQSRILEEALLQASVPYRVYGGMRFFERAEIKDALAYLRLVCNREDDSAFERVVNVPARGIGQRTLELLRDTARSEALSLWQATLFLLEQHELAARAANALESFLQLITTLTESCENTLLKDTVKKVVEESHLMSHYLKEGPTKAQVREENLAELVTAAGRFNVESEDTGSNSSLQAFLTYSALEAGEGQSDTTHCVQLMTLHAAKGLEFPVVFLLGLEEGIFPHKLSMHDPGRMEEERRLCYVGITRAMEKLYVSHAEKRYIYGTDQYQRPSRFLSEIPEELLQSVRMQTRIVKGGRKTPYAYKASASDAHASGYYVGQTVQHKKFGEGLILQIEGKGEQARVQVNFAQHGIKWLVAAVAFAGG